MTISYTEKIVSDIRKKFIDKVRQIDAETYDKLDLSNIYNTITIDTQNVADIVDIVWYLLNSTILSLFILLYISYYSQMTFLYVLLFLLVSWTIYHINNIRVFRRVMKARKSEKVLFESINDLLFGFKELQINRDKCKNFYQKQLLKNISTIQHLKTKSGFAIADGILLPEMTWLLSLFIIVYLSTSFSFLKGDALIKSLQIMIYLPISYILEQIPFVAIANISIQRIIQIEKKLDQILIDQDKMSFDQPIVPVNTFDVIKFQNICFRYTDYDGASQFTLGPLNFSVKKNEITFITGGNGSGKSTLLKLITGLYYPFSGVISMDNDEVEMSSHRHLFSPIFSDFHLFDKLYGLDGIDSQQVEHLIKKMELQHKVSYVNGGFNTIDLSTGQKKRLALISALLEDKPIYIFDEWAAEQNVEFREYFYKILLFELKQKGKTIIAVSHDDQYFHVADKVLSLEYGTIQ